jgi:hypothetical protein
MEGFKCAPVVTPPALTHWADAVSDGASAPYDPKSIALWARAIGKSPSSVEALCDLADVPAKRSCSLVRVVRAVRLAYVSGRMNPSEWLDVADARTLKQLLVDGGLKDVARPLLCDILRHQSLITSESALALLSRALHRKGWLS